MSGFIFNMIKADKNNERADNINIKALNKMEDAQRERREQEKKTMMALEKLANRKKGILSTSIKDFIDTYEKIMTVNFNGGKGIKELSFSKLTPVVLGEMKSMVSTAGLTMTTAQTVSTFLIGNVIGSAIDIAIGGLVLGGVISGVSNVIAKEAELNVSAAQMRKKQATVVASQAETVSVALNAIFQRAERISELLAKLNIIFRKSIEVVTIIIDEKGIIASNYSDFDIDCITTCINIASAIKSILETPLINENGEITAKSMEAIEIGEEYLQKINREIG